MDYRTRQGGSIQLKEAEMNALKGGAAVFLTALICVVSLCGALSMQGSPITLIADSNGGYSNFSVPSVNSIGIVAFKATNGGSVNIYKGDGGPVLLALNPSTVGLSFVQDAPAINDLQQVGFVATGDGPDGPGINVYRAEP